MLPRAKSHTPASSSVRYAWLSKCRMPCHFASSSSFTRKNAAFGSSLRESQILIEAAGLLTVQVDVKELACLERLRDAV